MKSAYFDQTVKNIAKSSWWLQALIVAVVLFVGTSLRSYQADLFPIDNLDDGIYYVWAGVSFWQNPLEVQSLTLFDSENDRLFWRSQYMDRVPSEAFGFRLVEPWFDHPPLGTAVIGLPAYLLGYTAFENIPYGVVRLPAVLASILTMLFTYLFLRSLFGFKHAIVATIVLAVTPYFVFAHRQSYLENILTPVFLLAVWQGYEVITHKSKTWWSWALAIIASFLCGWIKLVGLVVPLLLGLWAFKRKNWNSTWIFAGTLLASIGSYLAYGFLIDATGFWQTLTTQQGRGMFWGNASEIISNQGLATTFHDTSLLLAWIAVFIYLIASRMKKETTAADDFFAWVFMAWLLVVVITTGRHNNFVWYRYPLFPMLSYGVAWLILKLWKQFDLVGAVILTLLGWSQLYVLFPEWLENGGTRILVLLALVIPYSLYVFAKHLPSFFSAERINKVWLVAICSIIILTNILVTLRFSAYKCAVEVNCKLPVKIFITN